MRNEKPHDVRNGQLIYIERSDSVCILKRDGNYVSCQDDVLSGKNGTSKGRNYLSHDLVPFHH